MSLMEADAGTMDPAKIQSASEAMTKNAALRRHHAVFHHLVGHGMVPDHDLVGLLDLSGVRETSTGFAIPPGFVDKVRAAKPAWFGDTAFDARTASPADLKKQLATIRNADDERRNRARDARDLAGMQRRFGRAG